jgi:4-aminobutyrate aminotransferase
VSDTRGLGLCLGVELSRDGRTADPERARRVFFDCVRDGTIVLWNYGDTVLRIQPPLTISEEELDGALDTVESALRRTAR